MKCGYAEKCRDKENCGITRGELSPSECIKCQRKHRLEENE